MNARLCKWWSEREARRLQRQIDGLEASLHEYEVMRQDIDRHIDAKLDEMGKLRRELYIKKCRI